jgi:alpha-beta hydrolase superfamily lysophospholipase
MPRPRVVTIAPPEDLGRHEGLAYALFLPAGEPLGSVLILHGAGSVKESHYDFARACRAQGFAALCFDARGHGESEGALGRGLFEDLSAMASLLPDGAPLALRGSSMGGYLAIVSAERLAARAVVAICPASAEQLRRGLRTQAFDFRADADGLDALLAEHDEMLAAQGLEVPLLLLHAEGDERVPVEHSRELAEVAPQARLIAVPGGHHRSVQHDGELQAAALRWLEKSLSRR